MPHKVKMIKKRCFWEGLQYFASPDLWKRYFWKVQNTRIPIGSYLSQNNSQLERMSSWFLRGGGKFWSLSILVIPETPWGKHLEISVLWQTLLHSSRSIYPEISISFRSAVAEKPRKERSPLDGSRPSSNTFLYKLTVSNGSCSLKSRLFRALRA